MIYKQFAVFCTVRLMTHFVLLTDNIWSSKRYTSGIFLCLDIIVCSWFGRWDGTLEVFCLQMLNSVLPSKKWVHVFNYLKYLALPQVGCPFRYSKIIQVKENFQVLLKHMFRVPRLNMHRWRGKLSQVDGLQFRKRTLTFRSGNWNEEIDSRINIYIGKTCPAFVS